MKVWVFEDEQLGEMEVFASKRPAALHAREVAMGAVQSLDLTLPSRFFDTFLLDPESSLATLQDMGVLLWLFEREVRC